MPLLAVSSVNAEPPVLPEGSKMERAKRLELLHRILQDAYLDHLYETAKAQKSAGASSGPNSVISHQDLGDWSEAIDEILRGWLSLGSGLRKGVIALVRSQSSIRSIHP
ncbi:MAG: hypothetical protein JSS11_08655 [Verrucomicrobia bacterium]|nr:hypothetical protein [Verrucomicrobiota bacterium]